QAFSGKSPEEVEQVKRDGRAPYALRPEFTPTLARMYAAKANTLPKPCQWFMAGPFFRAERPQRGRLREFLQWNVDFLGMPAVGEEYYKGEADADVITTCVDYLQSVGLTAKDVRVKINSRQYVFERLRQHGVDDENVEHAIALLDSRPKIEVDEYERQARDLGLSAEGIERFHPTRGEIVRFDSTPEEISARGGDGEEYRKKCETRGDIFYEIQNAGIAEWCEFDNMIVRGLAYYTGTVFEVIADGERAVAGGGRYDNLISLFGGPPTPAVGFAMGDVVLSLLLQDKGLMPTDDELLGLAGQHPDVFVLSNGSTEAEAKVRPVVAMLRRGERREEGALSPALSHGTREREQSGLHVRHSYKATKKIDKLLTEAKKQHARFAVIIEDADSCIVKDLRSGEQWTQPVALNDLYAKLVAAT
ncbi:MAG: ATP phosphoribosyltransferase regulatory subunit, partial [Planctomycetota bacterium]|nr:ATP phosphoribosyltransferase regulatory subunit [Planctomycetota bacterium]